MFRHSSAIWTVAVVASLLLITGARAAGQETAPRRLFVANTGDGTVSLVDLADVM